MIEIVLGIILGAGAFALGLYIAKHLYVYKPAKLRLIVSQSRSHQALESNMIILPMRKSLPETQSTIYEEKTQIRVLFNDKNAYWIKDNSVYCAKIDENGLIVQESAEKLDMMGMDKIQLDEMMFIVDRLTEGKNDNWSAGN